MRSLPRITTGARIETLNSGRLPIYEPGLDRGNAKRERRWSAAFHVRIAPRQFAQRTPFSSAWERRRSIPAKPTFPRSITWRGRSPRQPRSPKLVIEKSTVPAHTGEQLTPRPSRFMVAAMALNFGWRRIPNSCARAPRSVISSIPNASWLAWKTRNPSGNCAKSTSPSSRAPSVARFTSRNARRRPLRYFSSPPLPAPN